MKASIYIFVAVFTLAVFSCEQDTIEPVTEDITGLWRYVYGVDDELLSPADDLYPVAYIRFDPNGKLQGYTSRNWITGDYSYDSPESISFSNLSSTYVADTYWSGNYHSALLGINMVGLDKNQLTLINSNLEQSLQYILVENCLLAKNNHSLFESGESDPFKILQVKQIEECLEVIISYAGGCKSVQLDLIGSGDYAESEPPQLMVRLILDDDDSCEALVTKRFYFNVEALQYSGSSSLILNMNDYEEPVWITYDE